MGATSRARQFSESYGEWGARPGPVTCYAGFGRGVEQTMLDLVRRGAPPRGLVTKIDRGFSAPRIRREPFRGFIGGAPERTRG